MTATILPLRSRSLAKQGGAGGLKRTTPERHGVEVVRLDLPIGEKEDALDCISVRPSPTGFPVVPDLPNGSDSSRCSVKRVTAPDPPLSQWGVGTNFAHRRMCKPISYYLTRLGKRITGSFVSADILQFCPMERAQNRLREIRIAAGLSQEELGGRVGVHKVTISDLERGKVEMTLSYMRRLAKALGVAPADLLVDDDNPNRLASDERDMVQAFRDAPEVARSFLLTSAMAVANQHRQEDDQRSAA
jgi:transcriptional regulator with XRE-family HTH domain